MAAVTVTVVTVYTRGCGDSAMSQEKQEDFKYMLGRIP